MISEIFSALPPFTWILWAIVIGGVALMHLLGSGTLFRMKRKMKWIGRGYRLICEPLSFGGSPLHGDREVFVASIQEGWWWAVLPWPGKKKWAAEILTKVIMLGVEIEYVAVSELDWDEAYVITVDENTRIASSSELACALAYLKHIGVEK